MCDDCAFLNQELLTYVFSGFQLSVLHEMLWTAFNFFQVPEDITRLVKAYSQDLQFCVTAQASTTARQHLEIVITAVCTISPLALPSVWSS